MSISEFREVENLFASKGVRTLYVKKLSNKQDNDKNQIYLGNGKGVNSIINLFPAKLIYGLPSESKMKRRSAKGAAKIEAHLNFYWLYENGDSYHAPTTKIINYFQYPEARLSGFIKGCKNAPQAIRRTKQSEYGARILMLGIGLNDITYGLLLTELDDPLVTNFPELTIFESIPILNIHIIGKSQKLIPKDQLLSELREISGDWHPSVILKDKVVGPEAFKGNQGAGYTLEALLDVVATTHPKNQINMGLKLRHLKPVAKFH